MVDKFKKYRIYFVLLISVIFNFYDLAKEGFANTYYSAGVKSMLTSWKSFFYASFDSENFVTIDKPPLGLWIQAISAKIFGFSGWSVLVPQALAGVISVYLVYYLVKKSFGENTGLLAGLILAVTPMFIATSRNNTIDNLLIVTLLFATVFIFKAVKEGKLKYLLLSVFVVGLGFNIKMLQAYMVLPAIYGLYFLVNKISLKKRIIHLVVATLLLIAVSLSWATIVDLTPEEDRPYIGSSEDNTVYELIFGHNGISRFTKGNVSFFGSDSSGTQDNVMMKGQLSNDTGQMTQGQLAQDALNQGQEGRAGRGMAPNGSDQQINGTIPSDNNMMSQGGARVTDAINGSMGGAVSRSGSSGKRNETGNTSILRLFNSQLSGQISWTLVFALISTIFLLIKSRFNFILDTKLKKHVFFWSAWAIPMMIYFSYTSGIFHRYYVSMVAPAVAALTAIGAIEMWKSYRESKKLGIFLPLAIGANGIAQVVFLNYYSSFDGWIVPIVLVGSLGISASLTIMLLISDQTKSSITKVLAVLAIGIQLIAPIYWSSTLLIYEGSSLPYAGPELITEDSFQVEEEDNNIDSLISYLEKNYNGETFLVAVPSSQNYGSDLILETDYAVMAMGGFGGSDNILDEQSLQDLVDNGEVRYFIISNNVRSGSSSVNNYIMENGTLIDSSLWQGSSVTSLNDRNSGNVQLYDMKN